jgi:putative transposase
LEKGDYDAAKNATMTLSNLRETLHVWIVDHYHQRPHKTLGDTPAHAWKIETVGLDIPIPADPNELKAILGTIDTRRLTHKGIEINSLFYNSPEVQLVSRRLGNNLDVTVRFQADNVGEIHILVPDTSIYLAVPAIDLEYARGLTLWQHKVCRRFAKRNLQGRTDVEALAEAKRRITELVLDDFDRKARRSRNRSYRFLGHHGTSPLPQNSAMLPAPPMDPPPTATPTVPLPKIKQPRTFKPLVEPRRPDSVA